MLIQYAYTVISWFFFLTLDVLNFYYRRLFCIFKKIYKFIYSESVGALMCKQGKGRGSGEVDSPPSTELNIGLDSITLRS